MNDRPVTRPLPTQNNTDAQAMREHAKFKFVNYLMTLALPMDWVTIMEQMMELESARDTQFKKIKLFLCLGSIKPREYNWGATWKKKLRLRSRKPRLRP
jgi:hypothetical protein